ncbi:MAG: glycerol-3-phosphate 1-O-acyltransferase PlsY [Bacteroidetes bacterium]|nr:glycerol-3-phosphate 1-O-acyltransferase PlsY [Bacteroidota bacterium]
MNQLVVLSNLVPVLVAYLLGSIPTAVWIGKMFYGIDVRQEGSGNAGATNTIRVLGLKAGIPVLLIDVFKGFIAIYLAQRIHFNFVENEADATLLLVAAAATVLGHTFPVFAQFKGGKGVATLLGIGLGLYPWAALGAILIFTVVLLISGYVSLSSMSAGIAFPFMVVFLFPPDHFLLTILAIAVAVFLPITHRKNITRLLNGTESKFRPGKSKSDS